MQLPHVQKNCLKNCFKNRLKNCQKKCIKNWPQATAKRIFHSMPKSLPFEKIQVHKPWYIKGSSNYHMSQKFPKNYKMCFKNCLNFFFKTWPLATVKRICHSKPKSLPHTTYSLKKCKICLKNCKICFKNV